MSTDDDVGVPDDVDDVEELRRHVINLAQRVQEAEQRAADAEREAAAARQRAKRAERAAHAHSAHLRAVLEAVERNQNKPGRETWNHVLSRLCRLDLDDYRADPMRHLTAVERVGSTIERHESIIDEQKRATPDPMMDNWESILEVARNVADDPEHMRGDGFTKLFWKDIKGATGHSERHCKRLIEQLGESMEGADWIPYESPSPSNNHSVVRKTLLVDLSVWSEDGEEGVT